LRSDDAKEKHLGFANDPLKSGHDAKSHLFELARATNRCENDKHEEVKTKPKQT
jgi:hypothetical protein